MSLLQGGDLSEPHILLVKQFRPPVGKYSIEMPAGLIDPGETPEKVCCLSFTKVPVGGL